MYVRAVKLWATSYPIIAMQVCLNAFYAPTLI